MEIPGNIQLLVAALDLKVVQLLRNAMNSNLPKTGPLGTIPVGARFHGGGTGAAPRQIVHPETRYEPRRVIHPEPRYEMRRVYHPIPRVEDQPVPFVGYDAPVHPKQSSNPLQPPWAQPIWSQPVSAIQHTAKVVVMKVDNSHKGALLDLFV